MVPINIAYILVGGVLFIKKKKCIYTLPVAAPFTAYTFTIYLCEIYFSVNFIIQKFFLYPNFEPNQYFNPGYASV